MLPSGGRLGLSLEASLATSVDGAASEGPPPVVLSQSTIEEMQTMLRNKSEIHWRMAILGGLVRGSVQRSKRTDE
jgi:hypothetical protein